MHFDLIACSFLNLELFDEGYVNLKVRKLFFPHTMQLNSASYQPFTTNNSQNRRSWNRGNESLLYDFQASYQFTSMFLMDFLDPTHVEERKIALNLECSPIPKLWAFSGEILIQISYIQSV